MPKFNSAEGGSDTTDATVGNSGGASGDAFDNITPNTGGTIKFSATQRAQGGLSYALSPSATLQCYMNMTDTAGAAWSERFYLYVTGAPSSESVFNVIRTSGGVACASLNFMTTRALKVLNAAGGILGSLATPLALNTLYRVSFFGTIHASTATVTLKVYRGHSYVPDETLAYTGANTGSTNATNARIGKQTGAVTWTTFYLDEYALSTTSSQEFPPAIGARPVVRLRTAVNRAANF